MVRAHFRNASSTFSPVRALVSRNISLVWGQGDRHSRTVRASVVYSFHSDSDLLPLILNLKLSLRASIHVFSCRVRASFPRVPTELFLQNSAPISLLQEGSLQDEPGASWALTDPSASPLPSPELSGLSLSAGPPPSASGL